jgi:hypothetical protein
LKPIQIDKKLPILRAFRYRNYRLYFIGQGISQIGNWSTLLATSWLVYQLTDSPLLLGVVGFATRIPTLFILPIAVRVTESSLLLKLCRWCSLYP